MQLVFAGTPPFAATALDALARDGHEVQAVLTQPDRPAGRGLKMQASAVKQWAVAHGVPVLQPRSLRLDGRWPEDASAARAALEQLAPPVMVVAAYGLILPAWTLALPRHGCLNIHASLLPRWRGAAPIQRAIEAGDPQTGVTIMRMDEGLDTGEMLLARPEAIRGDDTAGSLLSRLADLGAELIVQALRRLESGGLPGTPQPASGITYAHKIGKADAQVDWSAPAPAIERRLRALDPAPGATAQVAGLPVKIWRAVPVAGPPRPVPAPPGQVTRCDARALHVACGEGELSLLELQPPGGRRMAVEPFLQTVAARALRAGCSLADAAPAS
jgi:methionyl-tRNA formyltransferase